MAKKAILQQIAQEMNDVMAYGCDNDGVLLKPEERIDPDLTDKALEADIIRRCKEDLAPGDEESFSPEVWEWFMAHDAFSVPAEQPDEAEEPDNDDNDEAEEPDEADVIDVEAKEVSGDDNDEADDELDEKPAPKRAKKPIDKKLAGKPKHDTEDDAQEGAEKPRKTEKRASTAKRSKNDAEGRTQSEKSKHAPVPKKMAEGGNERFALDLVKQGLSFDDFCEQFKALYAKAAPERGEKYALQRAKVYWNIANKRLADKKRKKNEEPENDKPAVKTEVKKRLKNDEPEVKAPAKAKRRPRNVDDDE